MPGRSATSSSAGVSRSRAVVHLHGGRAVRRRSGRADAKGGLRGDQLHQRLGLGRRCWPPIATRTARPTWPGAVQFCRAHGIAVMLDLLLGGPGETPAHGARSDPLRPADRSRLCGARLGVRLYPDTASLAALAAGRVPMRAGIRGSIGSTKGELDLLRPTFYIAPALGETPARLIRDLIGGDRRFFEPQDESPRCRPGGGRPAGRPQLQRQPGPGRGDRGRRAGRLLGHPATVAGVRCAGGP